MATTTVSTSAQLAAAISDETGTGANVHATSPTLVTPALGTPASGVATNLTGTAAGLTAGNVTTNANLTGHVTSTGNATVLGTAAFTSANLSGALTDETGSGAAVFATSPTLVTPALGTPASGDLSNCTSYPAPEGTAVLSTGEAGGTKFLREDGDGTSSWQTIAGGGDALVANPLSQFAATTSAELAGVISDETGTGALVLATSPTLVTPALGTPASGNLSNCTAVPAPEGTAVLSTGEVGGTKFLREDGDGTSSWQAIAGGGDALVANPLSQFAATTSAQLAGVISDETGTGALVLATSPSLVTPALGTPASGVLTNCTGTAASLTAGAVTTNANLTGHVTSVGNAAVLGTAAFTSANLSGALTDETGSGAAVFATSPTLVTPALGTPASGDLANCTAASGTAKGPVELATSGEIDTGTDSTRAVPVDQFVASKRNIRWLVFNLVEAATDCAAATNIAGDFVSPIAGTILQSDTSPFYLYATNSTAGTTGTMVVDISIGGTSIMTTNKIDFDTTEKTTTTAATPPDLTTTALAVGDIITIDIDSIHTTAAKGLTVYMAVRE